jgi:hypothetical protein
MKISGGTAPAYLCFERDFVLKESGASTIDGKCYIIVSKAASGSGLPAPFAEGDFFMSPKGSTGQMTLAAGDAVYEFDLMAACKTTADWSVQQGTIDVGDDCDPGATIPDGIIAPSGSLSRFFHWNDVTMEYDDVTARELNHFFPVAHDNGLGTYTRDERNPNEKVYLLFKISGNVKAGQSETWMFLPIVISENSGSFGQSDGQNIDLSWTKGEGKASIYIRAVPAS